MHVHPRLSPSHPHWLHRLSILLILWLSAGLRWYQPGLVEFKYDEAHILGMAQSVARGHDWPLLSGGTSIGLPRAALDVYLLAPPLALTQGSPLAAVLWLGMLGVLAVALTYLLGRMMAGHWVGLFAAAYMGLNPWLVFYDRKLWAHIQVLFSVLLLLLAWQVVVRGSRKAAFGFPIVAVLQWLTHVLALVQVLSWLGAGLLAPRRWLRRPTLWGTLAGLGIMLPYLVALVARAASRGQIPTRIAAVSMSTPTASQTLINRWELAWRLFTGDRIFELAGVGHRALTWDHLLVWAGGLAGLAILAGIIRTLIMLRQPSSCSTAALLLVWGLGPTLALSFGPLTTYLQYWTVLLPLPGLFFALGLSWPFSASRQKNKTRASAQLLAVSLLLVLALFWGAAWESTLARIQQGMGRATFGRPLQTWQLAMTQAQFWARKYQLDQVKVLAQGVDPGQESEPAAIADLIGNPPYARFLDLAGSNPGLLLHEQQPSLYLTTTDAMRDALLALGQEIWTGPGPQPLRLYLLPPASQTSIPITPLEPPAVFDVGVALVGYLFPQPWPAGQQVQPMLVWHMREPGPQAWHGDYTAFNHIVRAQDGSMAAQRDGMAMLSRDWWPGDILYQLYPLTLKESGSYLWRTGLYSRPQGTRAQLSQGGDTVELPFRVEGGGR